MAIAAAGPADLVLPADGAVCEASGQFVGLWGSFWGSLWGFGAALCTAGETLGLGKVQAFVGLLSLKKGSEQRRARDRRCCNNQTLVLKMDNFMKTSSKEKHKTDFSGDGFTLSRFSYGPIFLRVEGLLLLLTSSTPIK